jgi:16S rRNA pseudouridine516 synthase
MKQAKDIERLDKVLANNGFGTRKDVRRLVRSGAVTVNGEVQLDFDSHVNIQCDVIAVDGETVAVRRHVYLMMNKAAGTVCSLKGGAHDTVYDQLPAAYRGKFLGGEISAVGRLDVDTEGLLILTTDGVLNHQLTSPRQRVAKVYRVQLRDGVDEAGRSRYAGQLAAGMHIPPEGDAPEADCLPAELAWGGDDRSCDLTVYEGKYHEVKRLFAALGNEVVHLKRIAVGTLSLDASLVPGECRELTEAETAQLRAAGENSAAAKEQKDDRH